MEGQPRSHHVSPSGLTARAGGRSQEVASAHGARASGLWELGVRAPC